jgi:DNA-binding LacI/PurR family transcriptional regulator
VTRSDKRPPRAATLQDVAARAKVSVATVSNLLNGRGHEMGSETRERVAQAMVALDYRPNVTARGLRSSKTRALGFLVLDDDAKFLADPMTDMVIAGAGDVTRERGYGLLIQSARIGELDDALLRPLRESRVDGAIMYLSGEPTSRGVYTKRVEELGYPCVLFGESSDNGISSVVADNTDGAYRLAAHLLERGHRQIAFVSARTSWPMIEDRYSGYRAALQDHGVPLLRELQLFRGRWDAASGAAMADALFELKEPPTAIMAANDLLALGVMRAAQQRGLRIPEDVAICGFNNFDFAAFVNPPLTTVALPVYEMGRAAATILIDGMEGGSSPETKSFPVEVIVREST